MAHDPRIISQEKLESMRYACDQLLQRGSNSVELAQWRRRVLLLLGHIEALEARGLQKTSPMETRND